MDLDEYGSEMKDALRRNIDACKAHPEMISCTHAVAQIELNGMPYEVQVRLTKDKGRFISLNPQRA